PTAHLSLKTTPGSFSRKETDATVDSTDVEAISFNYQQLAAELALNKNDLTADLIFASKQLGTATVQTAVNDVHTSRTLGGNLHLKNLKLDFLTPFVPDVANIDGVLSANARLAGTLEKPLLYGQLVLDKGQLTTRADEVKIRDLVTRLAIKGDHGEVSGGMRVGEGDVKFTGHLDWQTMPVTGQITLKGRDLEANAPGLLALKASPDLKLEIGAQQKLSGKIVIPWARIQIKDIPKRAILTSSDVVVVTPKDGKKRETTAMSTFTMNVAVVLGKDIQINAYGLKAHLGGHLTLLQLPGKSLAANGSIQILNGRYHQLGQDLLIKEGNIIFSGPISSPYLIVDAIRNPDSIEDDVTAGIKVTGTPTHPNIEIYSDPAMSQQQQLSYLLRGRGLDSGDDSSAQSMLIGLGVSQLGGAVSKVGEAFGLSDVSLDTEGRGDETQVTIGGNLAPGLRVQYGAGVFSSIAEIKIRYELMPHLYLQSVSGLAQAVDLFYQFKIKQP
ncbi:MAG: translocation/assembly module TamB domain-containing protein, partial [Endozoicomonas sp.]